jgi:hypothetical protein
MATKKLDGERDRERGESKKKSHMKRERLREKGGQEESDGGEKVRKRNYKKLE